MRTRRITTVVVMLAVLGAAGCSSSSGSAAGSGASSTTAPGVLDEIVNTWVGPPVDITRLPIGTSKVSLTDDSVGGLHACDAGFPNGGGAHAPGPWLDTAAGTWNLSEKLSVTGEVSWPMATYEERIDGADRVIISNGLPVGDVTGTFPIARSDPAYAYDRNPNRIAATDVVMRVPLSPVLAPTPGCLNKARIGVLRNGVSMFAPIDETNRDAVAYETQDGCDGHPQQASVYHYHDVPSCIREASMGPSTVVGFANDGFPIVVERDPDGNLPTNADLDVCHGRTSPVLLDGQVVSTYHYSATYEFPYFIGCFRGATS